MMKKLLASLSAAGPYYPPYLPPPSRGHIFPLRRRVPKNLGPRSIHLNIIISFRELGFQGILVFLFSLFFSLSLLDDLIVRSARESSISLFPPLRKPPSALLCPRDRSTRPPVTGTLHLPEHHHLRINKVWKINAPRGDLRG